MRHGSTTHRETFFHVGLAHPNYSYGTVFVRNSGELWAMVAAICSRADQFSRKRGRTISRRRYFQDPTKTIAWLTHKPTFNEAAEFVDFCVSRLEPK